MFSSAKWVVMRMLLVSHSAVRHKVAQKVRCSVRAKGSWKDERLIYIVMIITVIAIVITIILFILRKSSPLGCTLTNKPRKTAILHIVLHSRGTQQDTLKSTAAVARESVLWQLMWKECLSANKVSLDHPSSSSHPSF